MRLTSTAFEPDELIPERYACDGIDVSPPLEVHDLPETASTLALVMDDPDAPRGTWDHWVAYDIPVMSAIREGVDPLGTSGRNSWDRTGYSGPCCPPGSTHRYVFAVYAVDAELGLAPGADKGTLLKVLAGHVLAEARLVGRYTRPGG